MPYTLNAWTPATYRPFGTNAEDVQASLAETGKGMLLLLGIGVGALIWWMVSTSKKAPAAYIPGYEEAD